MYLFLIFFLFRAVLFLFCVVPQAAMPVVNERCGAAITVTLNQACELGLEAGGWYTSTLELQLVSLDFYEACRGVRTLCVNVKEGTPHSLRPAREQQTLPGTRSQSRSGGAGTLSALGNPGQNSVRPR